MSSTRRRLQRASAIVPLALVSVAWTASLASTGGIQTASEEVTEPAAPTTLPDGSSLPSRAIKAPASLSAPGTVTTGPGGRSRDIARTASTNAIPAAALAAYQRAETVINAADKSCRIPWQLVAAIGRVESDHGRTNNNVLSDDGLAQPGIYGIALDGSGGTSQIRDTDAGQLDNDRRFDRAVGPMQFIPSTWAVVGVDADGDGERNPQDIDDAALATAVYLCSGDDDLSALPGQRSAVFRYNHSKDYVDLVLSIMNSYLQGDFTSVPTGTAASSPIAPAPAPPSPAPGGGGGGGNEAPVAPAAPTTPTDGTDGTGGSDGGGGGSSDPTPTDPAPTTPSNPAPTNPPDNPAPSTPSPTPKPPKVPKPPSTGVPPVDDTISLAEAKAKCLAKGLVDNPLSSTDAFDKCVLGLTG